MLENQSKDIKKGDEKMEQIVMVGFNKDKEIIVWVIDDEGRLRKTTVTLFGSGKTISEQVVQLNRVEISSEGESPLPPFIGCVLFNIDDRVANSRDVLSVVITTDGKKSNPRKINLPL